MFSGSQKASSFVKHLKKRASFFEKLASFLHTVVNEKASSLWKLARFLVKWSSGWSSLGPYICRIIHYSDVIMGAMRPQITGVGIVYWTVCSDADKKQTKNIRVTGLCWGNSPLAGEFPAWMARNAENASIWWRNHGFKCYCCQADALDIVDMGTRLINNSRMVRWFSAKI